MIRFIKDFIQNVKKLLQWIPVIWKDQDWDQTFFYEILQFKLKRMAHYHRKYSYSSNKDNVTKQIEICVMLLNRIVRDDYLSNALTQHEAKWGKAEILHEKIKDTEYYNIDIKVPGLDKKNEKIETKKRRQCYRHSDYLKEQDINMLFEKLNKHIECWWD